MKRLRTEGGSLTGGTGDVSPQWMSFSATQSAADTTTTVTQAVPVQRMPTSGRAQVLEVLRVVFEHTAFQAIASATEALDSIAAYISTSSFGTTNTTWAEPRVFAGFAKYDRGAFTAAGTYAFVDNRHISQDLTDSAGHGVLIGTDNIFLQVQSSGSGASNVVAVKILYRWKNVSLSEYIGIVQSQQ